MKNNKLKTILFILLLGVLFIPKVLAEESYTITITGAGKNHTFEAYQVFKGNLHTENNKDVLSNIQWGSGVNGEALLSALKNDSTQINERNANGATNQTKKMSEIFASCTTARDVAEVLALYENNSDMTIAFAEVVSSHLSSTKVQLNYNEDSKNYTVNVTEAGYYFIHDTSSNDQLDKNEFYTRYIMKIVKSSNIKVKGGVPSVEKDVAETNKQHGDSTLTHNDKLDNKKALSAEIGEALEFTLTGTLPTNYLEYKTYKYIFHDTLSKGLTLDASSVKLYIQKDSGNLEEVTADNDKFTIANSKSEENGTTTLTITINDLKKIIDDGKYKESSNYKVIVKYYAYLNKDAVIGGDGNTNTVNLEFSNDPNKEGSSKTKTTPDDKVTVFTYQLNLEKKDGKNNTALPGVGFKLYKKVGETKYYAKMKNPVDEGESGKEYTIDSWTTTETEATEMLTDDKGNLKIRGLENGTYYLKESKTPDGFNTIEDVVIEITEEIAGNEAQALDSAQDVTKLSVSVTWKDNTREKTSTKQSANPETGIIETIVLNMPGSELPLTGGMGTLLLYAIGIILVIIAILIFGIKYQNLNKINKV